MKLKFRIVLLLFAFSIANTNAFGWNEIGHKLSAYVAWQQMTPEAREKAFRLLMAAPEDSDLNTLYSAFSSRSDSAKKLELFMFASTWPDVVRDRAFEVRYKKYNQGNWHYAGIFWKQENGQAVRLPDVTIPSGVAITKLSDFEKILSDPSYKDEEKAIALAWFLHVAGDIHNPVHNASRITETEPEGDQGANLFVLIPRTETSFGTNLHSYWDGIIGRVNPRKDDDCDDDYLLPIGRKMVKKYKFSKLSGRLNLSNYTLWNDEGFAFLNDAVYTNELTRGQMPPKKYEKRAYNISREQITLAGYRMGETLNRLLGSTDSPAK